MRNVHPKGSMSFALKLGQKWQEEIAEIPCGSKILMKSLYLAWLRRYKQICVFAFLAKMRKLKMAVIFKGDKIFWKITE